MTFLTYFYHQCIVLECFYYKIFKKYQSTLVPLLDQIFESTVEEDDLIIHYIWLLSFQRKETPIKILETQSLYQYSIMRILKLKKKKKNTILHLHIDKIFIKVLNLTRCCYKLFYLYVFSYKTYSQTLYLGICMQLKERILQIYQKFYHLKLLTNILHRI